MNDKNFKINDIVVIEKLRRQLRTNIGRMIDYQIVEEKDWSYPEGTKLISVLFPGQGLTTAYPIENCRLATEQEKKMYFKDVLTQVPRKIATKKMT